ncbi:MAG TPA: hypothetical protein VN699_01000 [Pirellulales bacterium]|nr:hypothetical protein [Pirellulales bacterium]
MFATIPSQPGFALWMMPHLLLMAAPPLMAWLWRRGGRFSLKHIFLATAAVAMLGNNIAWAIKAALAHGPIPLFKELAQHFWPTWLIVFSISLTATFALRLLFRNMPSVDKAKAVQQPESPKPIE